MMTISVECLLSRGGLEGGGMGVTRDIEGFPQVWGECCAVFGVDADEWREVVLVQMGGDECRQLWEEDGGHGVW